MKIIELLLDTKEKRKIFMKVLMDILVLIVVLRLCIFLVALYSISEIQDVIKLLDSTVFQSSWVYKLYMAFSLNQGFALITAFIKAITSDIILTLIILLFGVFFSKNYFRSADRWLYGASFILYYAAGLGLISNVVYCLSQQALSLGLTLIHGLSALFLCLCIINILIVMLHAGKLLVFEYPVTFKDTAA